MYNGHLSIEELEELSQQKGPAENQSHVENCRQCQELLEDCQAISVKLAKLASVSIGANDGMNCPDPRVWLDVAAGTLSSEETAKHVQHAADCPSCGPKLRTATRIFAEDLTQAEEKAIGSLPSASPKAQRRLAEHISTPAEPLVAGKKISSKRQPIWRSLVWATSAACVLLAFFAVRTVRKQRQVAEKVAEAESLVVAEYQKGRPTAYRVAGVPYGLPQEERGPENIPPSITVPEESKHPILAAQAALFERDPTHAIRVLEADNRSWSSITAVDNLAVAYAMRAGVTQSQSDYAKALSLCDDAIRLNPSDSVAYFNRALILEKLTRMAEARDAVQQFLKLEHDSNWRAEAEKIAR